VPCSRCGHQRPAAIRDENGQSVCTHCQTVDPRNHETCAGCGLRRPVNVRTPQGPLCRTCRPKARMTCATCGQVRVCDISRATGLPWCSGCQKRWAQCAGCGGFKRVRGGSRDAPLCAVVHPLRSRLLANLPSLRRARPAPLRSLPSVHPEAAAAGISGRWDRGGPGRTAGTAR
jgi:hypothetical protein